MQQQGSNRKVWIMSLTLYQLSYGRLPRFANVLADIVVLRMAMLEVGEL